MPTRLEPDARRVVLRDAEAAARDLGSATLEAEHLLMALATRERDPVGRLLADNGLDRDGIREALARETERSLAAVGVDLADYPLPEVRAAPRRGPKLAASSKRALIRAVRFAHAHQSRRITSPHLLIGVLEAELGTVPRALEAAGVDRQALRARAERL
jgi:ATP-dependent Clp protease ATP-binding subunit ClpA